jgi:hypothetical protein
VLVWDCAADGKPRERRAEKQSGELFFAQHVQLGALTHPWTGVFNPERIEFE